jgi:hypothetical protein
VADSEHQLLAPPLTVLASCSRALRQDGKDFEDEFKNAGARGLGAGKIRADLEVLLDGQLRKDPAAFSHKGDAGSVAPGRKSRAE